jgi:hypothetical protein
MAQPSIWGDALNGFQSAVANPLTLGGLSLLAGGDLNSGIQAGAVLQRQRTQQQQQDALKAGIMNLPGVSDADKQVLGANPEIANGVLSKMLADRYDPMAALALKEKQGDIDMQPLRRQALQAQIAGSQSENAIRGKSWGITGRDAYGQPTYGVVDLTKPNAGMPQAAAVSPNQPLVAPPQGPTGAEYLKTLPKPMADQVKAISEGRIPIPSGFALKTPYWQQMMTHVSQYDPNFDAINYKTRMATRKDFTSGKSAQNITSFNTAIGHLDELDKSIDALNNSDYTTYNQINNAAAGPFGNRDRQVALKNFNVARNAVKEELTRAFKGTSGSLAEVEDWNNQINDADSPAALHAAVKKGVDLLESRLNAVGDQYNRGMNTTADPVTLLSPKAQQIWNRLQGGQNPAKPEVSSAPRATVPKVGEVRDGFRFKGGNPGDRNSWEAAR